MEQERSQQPAQRSNKAAERSEAGPSSGSSNQQNHKTTGMEQERSQQPAQRSNKAAERSEAGPSSGSSNQQDYLSNGTHVNKRTNAEISSKPESFRLAIDFLFTVSHSVSCNNTLTEVGSTKRSLHCSDVRTHTHQEELKQDGGETEERGSKGRSRTGERSGRSSRAAS
ncbi:hypothetical protein Q5P01_015296 [Channa striata]|uniref:Uncharacterized protein n=1 Tax=Channa striata TaxID=64152 RepID=A0AA88MHE8_CHASR|nr:hypothetical protein Q5P01_015296 [Channa striata]